MRCAKRLALASLAGGLAKGTAMFLTFQLLGFKAGWLLDPSTQSAKLVAVWTTLSPHPRIVDNPLLMQAGFIVLSAAYALVYPQISSGWPPGAIRRGLRFSGILFLFSYVFWEFFTPFNLFGEPLPLIALELGFWALVALAEGLALAGVLECPRLGKAG